jgi:uncharacterized RDD family membrane protein YckC
VVSADAAFCPFCGDSTGASVPSQVSGPSEFDRLTSDSKTQEHWFIRVVAYIIDWIIVTIVTAVIALIIGAIVGFASIAISGPTFANFFVPFSAFGVEFFGLSGLFFLLYFAFGEVLYGKTIGKSLLGLRVITTDGSRLDLAKTFIRNVSKIYWLLLLLDLIGGFFLKVKPGQRYLDKIANTIVISDR